MDITNKLTLSMTKETIARAKRIKQERGVSISKMVEEYFEKMKDETSGKLKASARLKGALKGKLPDDLDWKKEVSKALLILVFLVSLPSLEGTAVPEASKT